MNKARLLSERLIFPFVFFSILNFTLLTLTHNTIFKILDDVIFAVIIIDVIMSKRYKKIKVDFWIIGLFFFFLFYTLWGYINNNDIMVIILQLRQYKYLFIFFYIFTFPHKLKDKKVSSFIWALLYLSIPFSIYQRLTSTLSNGDEVVGLFGKSGILSLVILAFVFSEVTYRIKNKKKVMGWYIITCFPMLINETKIIFILIPILAFLSLVHLKRVNVSSILTLILFVPLTIFIANKVYSSMYGKDMLEIFSKDYLENYFFYEAEIEGDMGRIAKVNLGYDYLKDNSQPINYWLGYGVGSTFYGKSSGQMGVVVKQLGVTRVFRGTQPQLFRDLIDYGIIGLLLVCVLFIYLYIKIQTKSPMSYSKYLALNLLFLTIFSLTYQAILTNTLFMFITFFFVYSTLSLPNNCEKK